MILGRLFKPLFFIVVCAIAFTPQRSGAATIIQRPLYIGLTSGLVGFWSFDGRDMNATQALDKSGQGNQGTLFNSPARTAGKVGQALAFNGGSGGGGEAKTIFLTSGTSWNVPADWNDNDNTIEVIGGGGGGGRGRRSSPWRGAGGGGGGAYASASNVSLTPSASVTVSVGSGGSGAASTGNSGSAGGDTYFCDSSSNCASIGGSAVVAGAKGGSGGLGGNQSPPSGGAGGSAASSVGTAKTAGGSGGNGGGGFFDWNGGGGGGGAAGPNGSGADGGNGESDNTNTGAGGGGGGADGGSNGIDGSGSNGGDGGNNRLGSGGGNGGGGAGSNGGGGGGGDYDEIGGVGGGGETIWTQTSDSATAGPGGGAGGGGSEANGTQAAGGLYGAGGAGGGDSGNDDAGDGAQGIIIITYTPEGESATNSYVDIGSGPASVNTVSFWMKTSATTTEIIDLNGSAYIHLSGGTITATGFTNPTIYIDGAQTSTLPGDDAWHHVVVATASSINASDLDIGRRNTSYFTGTLDDVRIYNRTLSSQEIHRLYKIGGTFTVNKAAYTGSLNDGLVGFWSFDGDAVSAQAAKRRWRSDAPHKRPAVARVGGFGRRHHGPRPLRRRHGIVNLPRLISSAGNRKYIWSSMPTNLDFRLSAWYP